MKWAGVAAYQGVFTALCATGLRADKHDVKAFCDSLPAPSGLSRQGFFASAALPGTLDKILQDFGNLAVRCS